MAAYGGGGDGKMKKSDGNVSETDLLLHPELLSSEFIKLVLHERKINTEDNQDHDRLTELYIQHVIPLPQRELPSNRWGKRMEKTKARQGSNRAQSSSTDSGRKRPLIVFDGSSASTGSVKLKKADDLLASLVTDRLKPPPSSINLSNPIRKLSGSSTNCSPSSSAPSSTQAPASTSVSTRSLTGNGSLSSSSLSSSGHSSSTSTKLKRGAPSDGVPGNPQELKSPEVKKKIQHVTWP
ncbi:ashwin isoform X1 [Pygocentrus nattereri]|uniref:Ashwin n=1 Tax=Pygocentrus nattereri TaxID=42514 RepID=A0A3B4BWY1_PYGNA|nr:ashwin isoform X1 [Pygocentrus nattereri]